MKKIMIIICSLVLSLSMISPIYAMDSVTETEPEKVEETVEQEDIIVEEVIVNPDTANEYTLTYSKDGKTVVGLKGSFVDVVIPEGVEHIGENAFYNGHIYSIQLPSTLLSIDQQAFYNCNYLKELIIPEGVETLGARFVSSCDELQNVVIPNTVTTIGDYAFSSCASLEKLVIPEGVQSIGEGLLNSSNNLKTVLLPKTLMNIGDFGNNKQIVYYVHESTKAHEKCLKDGNLFELRKGIVVFDSNPELKVGSTMDMVSYVMADPAFSNANVKVVSKSKDIVAVDESGTLTGLKLGVGTIEVTVDDYTISLLVSVSDELLSLVNGYVAKCSNKATEIVIPDGVLGINANAFENCKDLTKVSIPNTITRIEDSVFRYCTSLISIEIPSSVSYIGQSAFQGCKNLKSIIIPSLVTEINSYTFLDCTSLTNVSLPDNLTRISNQVFQNCTSLGKIIIPSSLKSVGSNSFSNCPDLLLVIGNNEQMYKYAEKNKLNYEAVVDNIELDNQLSLVEGAKCNLEVVFVPYFANTYTELIWASLNEDVVSVSETGELTAVYSGKTTLTVTTANGKTTSCEVTVLSPIEEIYFEKEEYTLERKEMLQLKTVNNPTYTNSIFTWSSSDETIATVDQNGVVTGKHSGKAVITVVADNGVKASCEVIVKTVELGVELNVYSLSLAKNDTYQLTSKVFPEDADQSVTWISSNPGCVKVDDNGLITAMYPGTAEITVTTSGGYTDVCEVVVTSEITKVELNREGASIPVGKTIQLYASVSPQDRISSMNLTWTSSDTSKATVDENGVVTGKNTGQVTIRATAENGLFAESEINVISSSVTKHDYTLKLKNYIIENGEYDSELDLHYIYVEKDDHIYMIYAGKYSVSFEAMYVVAEPEDEDYLFRIVEMGMSLPDYGISNSMTYVINEAGVYSKTNKEYTYYWYSSFVPKNFTYRFEETYMSYIPLEKQSAIDMEYTEETNKAFKQWNTMIKNAIGITMNDLGFKSFNKSSGKTSILATSIDINTNSITLDANEKYTLKATVLPAKAEDNKVTWTSSNPEVATVDSKGVVTAKEIGKTVIVAKLANGMYDYCEVSVEKQIKKITLNKTSVSLLEHETVDLVATITPSDTTQSKVITWTSSNENVASVDQNGHVVPKALGVTTITATASNGLKATCEVSVEKHIDSITLDITTINMNYGDKYKLIASITPEDTTDSKKITWTSSNTNVVKVDVNGNLTTVNPGTATVTAKTVNGLTATCIVNVYLQDITTTVSKASDTSLKVSWNKVNGASGYEVYRATSLDGTYTKVTTITKGTTTSYTNSKLTNGTTYFYKVRAYRTVNKKKVYGEYSEVVGYAALKTPSITVTRNNYDSIKITWKAISKAESYEIYRSTDNKNFELIDRISELSYLDEHLLTAKTYYYKVRAVKDCTTQEAYSSNSSVKSATTTLTVPTLNSLSDGVSTITLNWNTVDGADKYELYRATSSKGTYVLVQEFDTNEAYVDEVEYGKHYFYKIRAYHNNADGSKGYSSYSSVLVATCINAPTVQVTRASDTSLKVSWNKVNGASGYEVYRSASLDGTYSKVTTIKKGTTTSWTDTKRTNGTTYYYKVRAYKTISKVNGYGPYSEQVGYAALKTPSITVTRNSYDSIKITWKAISKAEEYEIYRSEDNKNFELIDRISDLSYVDDNLLTVKTYYYKVRAVKDCTTQDAYGANSSVKSAKTTLDTPKAKIDRIVYNRIDLVWDLVDGVDEYEIYRSTKEKGVYERIGTSSVGSYSDYDVEYGKTYYYKVRGSHNNVDGSTVYSSNSAIVKATVTIVAPKVVILNPDYKTIELNWEEVEGCTGYEIYRSTNAKKNFKQVATVTDGYYVDEELSTGTTYYYKIRGYREFEDGSKKYSSYTTVNKKVELKVPTNLDVVRISGAEAYITFEEVDGADGYEIYRATSKSGKYTKVGTVTDCEFTNSKLSSKSTYYYKVRAYRTVGKTKVYSGYTSVFTCKK